MAETPFYRRPLVIGLGVLLLGAGIWFLFLRGRTPSLSADGAKEKATAFLADVQAGRVDAAWEATSTDFKSMYGRDRFRAYVRSKPVLKAPAEFEKCEFKLEGDLRLAECRFRPVSGKGTITVVLHPDQGTWKVGRLSAE